MSGKVCNYCDEALAAARRSADGFSVGDPPPNGRSRRADSFSINDLPPPIPASDYGIRTNGSSNADNVSETVLEVVCLADVKPRNIEWLWKNWIAIGKVSVLAGDGGKGKSTILCDLAARTTTSDIWPDGANPSPRAGVLILAAEDDIDDTLAPRLIAAGADMAKVFTIRSVMTGQSRRTFSLQADLERLEAEIRKRGNVRLVIIDPISSYLGKVDSHKNAEVRSVLEPLGEMAARMRVAVICNNHFSKGGGNANSRIIGSVAFVNQARAAFIVTPDAEDASRLLLMPSKLNLAPLKHGLAYRIEGCLLRAEDGQDIPTSRIAWENGPVTMSADEALAAHDDGGNPPAGAEAEEFLRKAMANGPAPVKEIKDEAKAAGLSWATVRRAKDRLGVVAERESHGSDGQGRWLWATSNPARCSSTPQDAHVSNVSALHRNEHLAASDGVPNAPPFRERPDRAPALSPPGDSLDDLDGGRR